MCRAGALPVGVDRHRAAQVDGCIGNTRLTDRFLIGDGDHHAGQLHVVVGITVGGRAGIGVIDGEAVVPGGDVRCHGVEQRSGDVIAGIVPIKGTVKGAQLIPGILPARYPGGDAVLVVGLPQEDSLGAARAVACLLRVDVQPDPGDHLVRQIHPGKGNDADIVVAGIVEFLTGHIALGIGGRCVLPRAQGRGIRYGCRHKNSFPGISRCRSGTDCRWSGARRQNAR